MRKLWRSCLWATVVSLAASGCSFGDLDGLSSGGTTGDPDASAGGATIGLSIPSGKVEWRPTVRFSGGTLTTQLVSTNMTMITAGLSISTR